MLGLVLTLTGIVIGMIAGFTSIHLLVAIGGAMAVVGAALQYIDSTAYIMPLEKMKWRRREDGNFEARIPAWRHRKKLPMIEILEPTPGATAGLVSSDSDDRGNILLVRSGPCSAILRLV